MHSATNLHKLMTIYGMFFCIKQNGVLFVNLDRFNFSGIHDLKYTHYSGIRTAECNRVLRKSITGKLLTVLKLWNVHIGNCQHPWAQSACVSGIIINITDTVAIVTPLFPLLSTTVIVIFSLFSAILLSIFYFSENNFKPVIPTIMNTRHMWWNTVCFSLNITIIQNPHGIGVPRGSFIRAIAGGILF